MNTNIIFKMFIVLSIAVFCSSFKSKTESGHYYFYYEMVTHEHKWVYISDAAYGERPGTNLTVPTSKEKQRFINRVKSQYSSQTATYYIDDRVNYEFETDKEDLLEKRNDRLESSQRNGYKVFRVNL
mgnify:CR=1 FL=1